MEKVKDTKNPTVRQLQNIAENLKEHLKTYANVSINARCHDHLDIVIEYGIYIASDHKGTHIFKSWKGLLSFYHKLIKEEV